MPQTSHPLSPCAHPSSHKKEYFPWTPGHLLNLHASPTKCCKPIWSRHVGFLVRSNMSKRFLARLSKHTCQIMSNPSVISTVATSCNHIQRLRRNCPSSFPINSLATSDVRVKSKARLTHPARSRSLPFSEPRMLALCVKMINQDIQVTKEWIVLTGGFFWRIRSMMKLCVISKMWLQASLSQQLASPLEVTSELKRNQSAGPISFVVRIPYVWWRNSYLK